MTQGIEDVLDSLDRQRRLAWAKFYELARLVLADDAQAREVAAAALRVTAEPVGRDLPEPFTPTHASVVAESLGGAVVNDIAIAGRIYVWTYDGWKEHVRSAESGVDVTEKARIVREQIRRASGPTQRLENQR